MFISKLLIWNTRLLIISWVVAEKIYVGYFFIEMVTKIDLLHIAWTVRMNENIFLKMFKK